MKFRPQCFDYHTEAESYLHEEAGQDIAKIWIMELPDDEARRAIEDDDSEQEIGHISEETLPMSVKRDDETNADYLDDQDGCNSHCEISQVRMLLSRKCSGGSKRS